MNKPKISFLAFFLLWAEVQKWKVPDFHVRVCEFLEEFYLIVGCVALLMMPRGHSKSTILDVFNAWVIYCYPETQIRCGVSEEHSSISKNKRILSGIEGPLVSGLLWAHLSVLEDENHEDSIQVKQMREWNPAITDQPDDFLDSLALAIVEAPERVGKTHNTTDYEESPNWRTNGGVHEATLEFEN